MLDIEDAAFIDLKSRFGVPEDFFVQFDLRLILLSELWRELGRSIWRPLVRGRTGVVIIDLGSKLVGLWSAWGLIWEGTGAVATVTLLVGVAGTSFNLSTDAAILGEGRLPWNAPSLAAETGVTLVGEICLLGFWTRFSFGWGVVTIAAGLRW